jgi:hypothetical protein
MSDDNALFARADAWREYCRRNRLQRNITLLGIRLVLRAGLDDAPDFETIERRAQFAEIAGVDA